MTVQQPKEQQLETSHEMQVEEKEDISFSVDSEEEKPESNKIDMFDEYDASKVLWEEEEVDDVSLSIESEPSLAKEAPQVEQQELRQEDDPLSSSSSSSS